MFPFDHILLIGFGGPEKPEDVMPFLKNVTTGRNIPEQRLKAVAHHYEEIGGLSPYNGWASKVKQTLQKECEHQDLNLPVYLGMRNWSPYLSDVLSEIKQNGKKKGIAIILAPHKSPSSCERYKSNVKEAQKISKTQNIEYHYLSAWHTHPLFIEAQSNQIRKVFDRLNTEEQQSLLPIFTCHSIPLESESACNFCHYSKSFLETSQAIADKLSLPHWEYAYQSRSGNPSQPWLGPDILEKINIAKNSYKNILLIPVGFLSDNAEVLYDLDIEAKKHCEKNNVKYHRARTVELESNFIQMFVELIKECNVASHETLKQQACSQCFSEELSSPESV